MGTTCARVFMVVSEGVMCYMRLVVVCACALQEGQQYEISFQGCSTLNMG